MHLQHSVGLHLCFVVLGSGSAPGGDSSPAAILAGKGLAKSGPKFVIEAEKPVLAKMKEARAALARYARLAEHQAMDEQVDARLAEVEGRRVELQDEVAQMNQRINEQGGASRHLLRAGPRRASTNPMLIAQRDRAHAVLAEINREQRALSAQASPAKERTGLDEEVKKKRRRNSRRPWQS